MWLQKLSAFPPGNTFWKRSRRCGWDSFPSGHSDLKERNQCRMDFSSNLVLFKQKSKSLLFNAVPVGAQFLKAGSTFSSDTSPKMKKNQTIIFLLLILPSETVFHLFNFDLIPNTFKILSAASFSFTSRMSELLLSSFCELLWEANSSS